MDEPRVQQFSDPIIRNQHPKGIEEQRAIHNYFVYKTKRFTHVYTFDRNSVDRIGGGAGGQ